MRDRNLEEWKARVAQPEELTVGELNTAVRWLREELHQQAIKRQHDLEVMENRACAFAFEAGQEMAMMAGLWLPCDQTLQCALCGWIDWDEGPHPTSCNLGYMQAKFQETKEKLNAEIRKMNRDMASVARYAIEALEPVIRTGRTSEGGEQNGNRIHLEDTVLKLQVFAGKKCDECTAGRYFDANHGCSRRCGKCNGEGFIK